MDVNDVLICLSDDGRIIRLFGRVEELFRQYPETFIDKDIGGIFSDDILADYFLDPSQKIFHTGLRIPGPSLVPVSVSVHRDNLCSGSCGFLLTVRDISEKLKLQESIRRVAILEYEKKRADQTEHIFSELIHNVKNRLVATAGFAQILTKHTQRLGLGVVNLFQDRQKAVELLGPLLSKLQQVTEQIFSQVNETLTIVDTANKKTYWEREQTRREINLNELLQTELRIMTMATKTAGTQKVMQMANQLPPVIGVYSDFSQVFVNIINNAFDAMHGSKDRSLTIKTWCEEHFNIVEITDSGPGVPKDLREKIFEPFFTTKAVHGPNGTDRPSGTGLGLSSAKRILGRYAGDIHCLDSPKGGATFRVRIPYPKEIHKKLSGLQGKILEQELQRIVNGVENLPTVPGVLIGIYEAIEGQKAINAIAELLAKDYALVEKVLSVVNSAFFGLRRKITCIEEAVVYLGFRELQNIVQTLLVSSSLFAEQNIPFIERLWHHSLGTALLTEELCSRLKNRQGLAGAYLAALLHDVGEIVMVQGFPADYHEEMTLLEGRQGIIEHADDLILHNHIGYVFLKSRAGLAEELLRPILFHHHLPLAEHPLLSKIIFLADKIERYYPNANVAYRLIIQELTKALLAISPSELEVIRKKATNKFDFWVEKFGVRKNVD